jgi:ribulose-5-phosphate 4-epimerase/fuculose-1-phosphate aldolase
VTPAEARALVAAGCRVLGANGQNDWIWGHASVRDPDGRGVWLKAAGFGFEEIDDDRVLLVDRDGRVLEGEGRRPIEYPIHCEVLAARPDLGAVVHSHPDHCVAFAAAGEPLRPFSHAGSWFVPPDVPRFTQTSDLITTAKLGRAVADALGDHYALFLVNHGIVTAGPDLETAVVRALLLEQACRMQLLVRTYGGSPTYTPDEEALVKRRNVASELQIKACWDYLARSAPPA